MAAKVQNGSYVKIHGKCRLSKQGSHGAGNVRGNGRKAKAGCLDHDSVTCFSGYRLSPQALNIIVKRYATNARISFDDFVACCVRLKALTGLFEAFISSKKSHTDVFFVESTVTRINVGKIQGFLSRVQLCLAVFPRHGEVDLPCMPYATKWYRKSCIVDPLNVVSCHLNFSHGLTQQC